MDNNMLIDRTQNYYTNQNIFTGTEYLASNNNSYHSSFNIRDFGFGIAIKQNKTLTTVFEYHHIEPVAFKNSIKLFNRYEGVMNSINIGLSKIIPNTRNNIWNNIILRNGLYINNINKNNDNYKDFGFTIGLGLDYLKQFNSIDIALKFGLRENDIKEFNNEKYIELIIGITSAEKWFLNRKKNKK